MITWSHELGQNILAVVKICGGGYCLFHGVQEADREIQEEVRVRYNPKGHAPSDPLSPTSLHLWL